MQRYRGPVDALMARSGIAEWHVRLVPQQTAESSLTLRPLCQVLDVRTAREGNVPQEMVKMGPSVFARRQSLASEEAGGHLQVAPPFILSVSLAGDGAAAAQRGFAIPRRQLEEISLAVRPCAGLWHVLPPLIPDPA